MCPHFFRTSISPCGFSSVYCVVISFSFGHDARCKKKMQKMMQDVSNGMDYLVHCTLLKIINYQIEIRLLHMRAISFALEQNI